jgi:GTP-binding protein
MKITSAKFIAGLQGTDPLLDNGIPQVAIIGRSNVGKSSVINSLTRVKDLARTSAFPGRTQEINLFLINGNLYLVDLPGYGYAQASHEARNRLQEIIDWYFLGSPYNQKVVILVIDAKVGMTDSDFDMLHRLEERQKNIVIVANKVDKLKRMELQSQLKRIAEEAPGHTVIAYSALEGTGTSALTDMILNDIT